MPTWVIVFGVLVGALAVGLLANRPGGRPIRSRVTRVSAGSMG